MPDKSDICFQTAESVRADKVRMPSEVARLKSTKLIRGNVTAQAFVDEAFGPGGHTDVAAGRAFLEVPMKWLVRESYGHNRYD